MTYPNPTFLLNSNNIQTPITEMESLTLKLTLRSLADLGNLTCSRYSQLLRGKEAEQSVCRSVLNISSKCLKNNSLHSTQFLSITHTSLTVGQGLFFFIV